MFGDPWGRRGGRLRPLSPRPPIRRPGRWYFGGLPQRPSRRARPSHPAYLGNGWGSLGTAEVYAAAGFALALYAAGRYDVISRPVSSGEAARGALLISLGVALAAASKENFTGLVFLPVLYAVFATLR